MMYQIIEKKNGKSRIKMVDSLQKCNDRLKQLRSARNGAVYTLEKTDLTEKTSHRTNTANYQAGGYGTFPRLVKWDK
jgi:DNA-binding FrmR family transcriptional regulator